jgi:hypothetical protein
LTNERRLEVPDLELERETTTLLSAVLINALPFVFVLLLLPLPEELSSDRIGFVVDAIFFFF